MSDNYTICELAVKNIVAGLTTYFETGSVTLGDFSPLDGGFDRVAVLSPGGFTSERGTMSSNLRGWTINIDIFQRFEGSADTYTTFKAMRAAIIDALDTARNLPAVGDVADVNVSARSEPSMVSKQGTNTLTHLVQALQVTIKQYVEVP